VLLGLPGAVRVPVARDLAAVGVEPGVILIVAEDRIAGWIDRFQLFLGDAEPDCDERVDLY
jgi:hypothetical protein